MEEDTIITLNDQNENYNNIFDGDAPVNDDYVYGDAPDNDINVVNDTPANNSQNTNPLDRINNIVRQITPVIPRRPLRNRHIGTEARMGFRDRIFDMLDQRRRGRINDAERRANIESRSIDAREAALNNILSQTSNFRDNLILQSQRDNLEHRRQDLENYRENIDQERRKFENLDTLLNGPDDNTVNPYIPDETTVREFRTEYRRVQRSERNYRTREITNALITGAAIIGVAWTLDQIDPSFINFNDTAQSINDSVQTGIHTVNVVLERFSNVAETIMNNPTFESVRDVINNGPAQLLTTSIVSAVYLRRTTRFHRLANEQQAERESMEENNPISVAEYVNNVRHL